MGVAPPGSFEGISYSDTLPLSVVAGPVPDAARLAGLNADNFQLLIADASLDEARVPASESKADDDSQVLEDLHRLEHKVNVLIQLVAKLVAREQSMPAPAAWRLYATGIEWQADAAPALPDSSGQVLLYVSRQFPQPLRLPGKVQRPRQDEAGTWQTFLFEGLSVAVTDGLERLIFRHHRRAVAGVRTHPRD